MGPYTPEREFILTKYARLLENKGQSPKELTCFRLGTMLNLEIMPWAAQQLSSQAAAREGCQAH